MNSIKTLLREQLAIVAELMEDVEEGVFKFTDDDLRLAHAKASPVDNARM